MNSVRYVFCLAVLSMAVSARGEESFTPLFDGKTLDGWTVKCKPKDKPLTFWSVDRGTILADSLGHKEHDYVWLASNKEYGDFELRLRFQVERGIQGNSGVQIRSRYDDAAGYLDGPQIDINPAGPWRTGMIWDETRGSQRWLYPKVPQGKWVDQAMAPKGLKFGYVGDGDDDGWNDLRIAANGMKIHAWLNEVLVADYDGAGVLDDALHRQRAVGRKGVIAIQIHTHDEVKIRFRDLRIREF